MANTTARTKTKRASAHRGRARRARSRRRARAHRPGVGRVRRELGETRIELAHVGEGVRRATTSVRQAGRTVVEAGQAGVSAARDAAEAAGERVGRVAIEAGRRFGDAAEQVVETARDRAGDLAVDAGRTAVGLGARILHLPELVREGARRGREAIETTGARAVVSVIQTGTKVFRAAAGYVSTLAPRHRVRHRALEQLVVEQLRWSHAGTEAYDSTVEETDDVEMRIRLVRFKLHTIKQAETLAELLREIGGRVPAEEKAPPPPRAPGRNGATARGPAAIRHGLSYALTVAVQSAEGWRALNRIATWAEQDRVADAILRATAAVGREPEEQVAFLRETLLDKTVQMVLG